MEAENMKQINQDLEVWNIHQTHDINFRVSKDLRLTFEGSESDAKRWIEKTFFPIEFKVNELFKTITFLCR